MLVVYDMGGPMKKKIFLLLAFTGVAFFCYFLNVLAYNLDSDNNPGSGVSGGSTGTGSGTNWPYQNFKVVRIRVFSGETVVANGYYSFGDDESNCYSGVENVTLCETSSYNYPNVVDSDGATCNSGKSVSFGCMHAPDFSKTWYKNVNWSYNGSYLDNYFKQNEYSNLKEILTLIGYSETNAADNDVVIIEPATLVICAGKYYFGTSTALMKKNVSYRGSSGNMCSADDNNYNGNVGYTFENLFRSMSTALKKSSSSNFQGNKKYTNFGFFEYNVSDFYEKPKSNYYLDLNGYLDSKRTDNISGYGTADIYINGNKVADDVSDYYVQWPKGTQYEIKDIKEENGKKYNGVHSGKISGTLSSDTSVYLDFSTNLGSIKIKKTNSSNDVLAQLDSTTKVKFQLYSDSNCTKKVGREFSSTSDIVSEGTYYLKEVQSKKGYHLPEPGEKWYCEAVIVTSGKETEIEVENNTVCEYKFNAAMTMKQRIELYNLIKSNYSQEFNGLLDMSNDTAATACKNIPLKKNYTNSCLASTSMSTNSTSFSNTNVSMYTEKYGTYTFCLTKFNLLNNLGKTSFNNIKSGQAIINTNDIVATATLNRVCYNFGDTNIVDAQYNNFKYSNYIDEDASIDGTKLIKSETSSGTINNKTITVTYTLPIMYASNKNGKVYYNSCPNGQYCKVLGRGIISKFNLKPGKYEMNFDIELNEKKFGSLDTKNSSKCQYTVQNELIDYNSKLSIAFRAVNTNSDALFLSKDGVSNRKTGSNWSSKADRDFVLKTKNNSYNKNNETPLYKITLTPQVIKEIRKNNKGKSYDDYNMTCVENGTICISNYLTCLQNRGILQIKERKNIDKFKKNQITCKY